MKDLKLSAELLDCKVRSNGDYDSTGQYKIYALSNKATSKRVTPYYSIKEWQTLNVAKVMLNYLNK